MKRGATRARLTTVLAAAGAAACAAAGAGSPPAPATALARLAASLQTQPETRRADFAAVALGEMLTAYEREFDRLSVPGQVSRRELAKQARWASALRAFLDELYAARDALDAGEPVQILVSPPAPVQLLVGERLVPLSSPRIDDPQALDAGVVALFCDTFVCDPDPLAPVAEPVGARDPAGGWSFRDGRGSTYETADGLGFTFSDLRVRSAKEQACQRVGEELRRLVSALVEQRASGRRVTFEALRLEQPGRGDDQRVVLQPSGARLRLRLPALAQAPGVLEAAGDWVRARVEGRPYRQLFPAAERLLARLLARP